MNNYIIVAAVGLILCCAAGVNAMESSKYIVYASQAGAKLDSNVLTGGGTDDTAALQAVLEQAPKLGRLILVMDGAALVHGLTIYSNTTIECLNQSCGFFLAEGANRAILQNVHPSAGEIMDRNITLQGGTFNLNRRKQTEHWVNGLNFYGIEGLILRDVIVRDQRAFAVAVSNFKRVQMEHISILLEDRKLDQNEDGLHFYGPGQFLTLRDIQGSSCDDFIALNADDCAARNKDGQWVNAGGPNNVISYGPITDVLIDGVQVDEATHVIRLLSRCSSIDRVFIRNVIGKYRHFGIQMNPWRTAGGNFGHVVFDTIDLRPVESNDPCFFLFNIGGKHASITIRNLRYQTCDTRRMINVEPGAQVGALTLDGAEIVAEKALEKMRYIVVEGQVDRLHLRNVQVTQPTNMPPGSCLIEIPAGEKPHGIGHLQMEDVTTRHLGAVVQQSGGTIGRRDDHNVLVIEIS